MRTRPRTLTVVLSLVSCLSVLASILELRAATSLPSSLSDQEFWALTEQLSEPNGFFRSENLVSNERNYQVVIPALLKRVPAGGVYLGVGPEQNFPYIVALKPRMAFIIDIRRGNLLEQLLYKALFEMSADRADFLSRLFSRKRPLELTTQSTVAQLFAAYDKVPASEDLYEENLKAVTDQLIATHHFKLSDADMRGIRHVYHHGFYLNGPNLNYAMSSGGGRNSPTYEELVLATDGAGENRGYLVTEENFAFLKNLETMNLVVPVVGDFGGPKAIRAIGQYVKDHDGTVAAFYVSNVEQFLDQNATWSNFCASVATLPLDEGSTYIFSGRGAPNGSQLAGFGGGLQTNIRPILSEVKNCSGGSR